LLYNEKSAFIGCEWSVFPLYDVVEISVDKTMSAENSADMLEKSAEYSQGLFPEVPQ